MSYAPVLQKEEFLLCPLCSVPSVLFLCCVFTAPPPGEKLLPLAHGPYLRELYQCMSCGHYVNMMQEEIDYTEAYVDATYHDTAGIVRAYERVMSLPASQSDNAGRVARICQYMDALSEKQSSVAGGLFLDVGAGLGVFMMRMAQQGWTGAVIEPDARLCAHLRNLQEQQGLDIEVICGLWWQKISPTARKFSLVTMNKVLEHQRDPIAFLTHTHEFLLPAGRIYVEVPSGERAAAKEGYERQEFFAEHHHVFSQCSLVRLAKRAGYWIDQMGYLHEPSGKHTLWAFLQKQERSVAMKVA